MSQFALDAVSADHRDTARKALAAAFGADTPLAIQLVPGGASGALTYRIEAGGRPYLLRLEGPASPMRNPHQYACMQAAADAGIAPPLRHVDAHAGVAIMDFLSQRPLAEYPGGPPALARALGGLAARLQATPPFPTFFDYPEGIQNLFEYVRGAGIFADGLLDPHFEGLACIRAALPWDPATHVSSHNDPNPFNVIFDGQRLWLVDWETACRNDPLVDVAIMIDTQAPTPDLETALLQGWLGRAPDRGLTARLALIRPLTRLYYACLLLTVAGGGLGEAGDAGLAAPTPEAFGAALASGELQRGPAMVRVLAKMQLAGFLAGLAAPGIVEAFAIVRDTGS